MRKPKLVPVLKPKRDYSKNLGKHLHAKGGGSVATRIKERMK